MGSAKNSHYRTYIYQNPSITLCTILKWNILGPIVFVRYAPALHNSQCNVWGEVVVHGKGAGVRSTSIEGGAIPNFCLFKLTNMGYFSRNHPPATHLFAQSVAWWDSANYPLLFQNITLWGPMMKCFPSFLFLFFDGTTSGTKRRTPNHQIHQPNHN